MTSFFTPQFVLLCGMLVKKVHQRRSAHVRSGVGAYAGAARRCVHIATILHRPPSAQRPDRRRARYAHIPQVALHLTQPRSLCTASRDGPAPRISTRKNLMGGSSAGSRTTCPYKRRYRSRTMQVSSHSPASLSTRSINI